MEAFLASNDFLDRNVSMLSALYFITSYLYLRDYEKVVEYFLFVLVEDLNAMDLLPWAKSLFDMLISSLRMS